MSLKGLFYVAERVKNVEENSAMLYNKIENRVIVQAFWRCSCSNCWIFYGWDSDYSRCDLSVNVYIQGKRLSEENSADKRN